MTSGRFLGALAHPSVGLALALLTVLARLTVLTLLALALLALLALALLALTLLALAAAAAPRQALAILAALVQRTLPAGLLALRALVLLTLTTRLLALRPLVLLTLATRLLALRALLTLTSLVRTLTALLLAIVLLVVLVVVISRHAASAVHLTCHAVWRSTAQPRAATTSPSRSRHSRGRCAAAHQPRGRLHRRAAPADSERLRTGGRAKGRLRSIACGGRVSFTDRWDPAAPSPERAPRAPGAG